MNKQFIIISLLLVLTASQQYSLTQCTCAQLLSETDCSKNTSLGCSWDSTKKVCSTSTNPTTPTTVYAAYCDTFAETDCPKAKPCPDCESYAACAWYENKCTFFTGCTPFAKTTDSDCQAISNRCITNGTHCVEIDVCSSYKKQLPCVKNASGSLCYWDSTTNTCLDANTCDRLPTTFATDKECRSVITTCTAKTGGGCVDSGNNCSDQTLEIQCVWNKLKTTACYWDGAACKDKICDSAPVSQTTDEACKSFRDDGSCTTKPNGGCVTRTTCAAATIQAACVKNSSGGDCYWTGTACVDKTCANAPLTMTTNTACGGFVQDCITKSGGGCVANGACSVATLPAACVKNKDKVDCIWDTTCKEKTCANAPITNNTHELCTSYLPSCTVKSGGGCQPRICSNAPITLTTNDACEAYLTGNNCITKTGGGCIGNTTCSAITLKVACIKNSSSQTCFWDDDSSSCKDKICVNAPNSNNSHEKCQAFLTTCTVNKSGAGCVEKTCENSLIQAICDKDSNSKTCIWKGKCYKKQCVLASQTITSHADCNTYDPSCTLSNTGSGCVPIPLKCEAITLEAACVIKANGQSCGWNGSCIDKACSTAPKTFTTTTECQGHLSTGTCVANNPVNGAIQGCQDLPTTCAARRSDQNCEIPRTGFPTCLWVISTSSCVEKSCATANTTGTTGALSLFSFSTCQGYLSICSTTNAQGVCTAWSKPCIANTTSDACISKPPTCNGLNSENCQIGSKASGDCYWTGSSCVDRTCQALVGPFSDSSCKQKFDQCTVNNAGNACQTLQTACTSYTTQDNCKKTSTNKNCTWTGQACRSSTCADAPDSQDYDTDGKCANYLTTSDTCTVVYKVGAQGCIPKSQNCTDYLIEAQCHQTTTNSSGIDDCTWIVDKCYAKSQFATGTCASFRGTKAMCEGYRIGCTNATDALSTANCTLNCSLKTGSGLTFEICQALDTTCSVKKDGSSCITIQQNCEGYSTTALNCVRSSASGSASYCVMNTASTPTCQAVTTPASHCSLVSGLTNLDHVKCQLYNSGCTFLKDGTACQEFKAKCPEYGSEPTCTKSQQGTCYWTGSACIRLSICSSITATSGLTDDICSRYNPGCVANSNGTACQEKKATCAAYLSQASCTTSGASPTANKCVWGGSPAACIAVTNVATHCAYVTATSGLTDDKCDDYNAGCVANTAGDACQEKKTTCAEYAQTSCTTSSAGKCYWNASATPAACISITTASSDCAQVIQVSLTDSICISYNAGCVANAAGSACQEKQATCGAYSTSSSCTQSTASKCFWNASTCISIVATGQCPLIVTSVTDSACNSYNAGCVANAAGSACQEKKATCGDYAQAACTTSNAGKCYWNASATPPACISITSSTDCAKVIGPSLAAEVCKTYYGGCKNKTDNSACEAQGQANCSSYAADVNCDKTTTGGICFVYSGACTAIVTASTDCAKVIQASLTDSKCSGYNAGCVANAAGSACQEKKAICGDYAQAACTTSNAGKCYWNASATPPACISITSSTDCAKVIGPSLAAEVCQTYYGGCKNKTDNSACEAYTQASCGGYTASGDCVKTSTGASCFWNSTVCISIVAQSQCSLIIRNELNDSICSNYNSGCVANAGGTACQEKKATCAEYLSSASCTTSNASPTANKCVWGGSPAACIPVTIVATHCAYVTATSGLTDDKCDDYNAGCVANTAGTACQEKKATCAEYAQTSCTTSTAGKCYWNASATPAACISITTASSDCAKVTGTGLNDDKCNDYNANCTSLKDGTGCQEKKAACKEYTTSNQCVINTTGACVWFENYCYSLSTVSCSSITGSNLDHDKCQAYNSSCTFITGGLACQDLKATCEEYTGTGCTRSLGSLKCYLNTTNNTCNTIAAPASDCQKITGTNLTYAYCQSYNTGCSVNRAKTACVKQEAQCSGYQSNNMISCYKSAAGLCIASSSVDNVCAAASTAATCEAVFLGSGNYNSANCDEMKTGCTLASGGATCTAKTCANAAGITFNHTNCKSWNNNCTVNSANNGCEAMKPTCAEQASTNCLYSGQGECVVVNSFCVTKTCDTAAASSSFDSDGKCSSYQSSCTVARKGACQARTACTSYKSQLQCKFNVSGGKCFWNPTNKNCVDLNCGNIEQTSSFDSHTKCVAVDANLACTVRATNVVPFVAAAGCMSRGACGSYTIEEQCKTNANNGECVWNTNTSLPNPACQDKSCTSAPSSIQTHNECYLYYNTSTVKCTVFATQSTSGVTLGGCQQTAACSTYIDEKQCQINANGDPCGWNGTQCADKTCATAPATTEYDEDIKCRAYIYNKCTVSDSGLGCVEIPVTCETMNQKQCYFNKAGDPCYWTGTACITKSCDNAPDTIASADDCKTYLPGCTLDEVKCKTKICEDFAYATDALCKQQALPTCTTNGTNCVTRGTCFQALNRAGCVVSSSGQQCEWIEEVLNAQNQVTSPAYCTNKSCSTAPLTLTSEAACAGYYTNCTTKNGGGCVTKSTCAAVTIDVACTKALDGKTECAWDSALNKCRDKDCQDYSGTTHAACYAQRGGCTAGANGKCARIQNCEQTNIRAACIEGSNGPCLWIAQHQNADGSKGACFKYTSCKSLNWNNDPQCKLISDKCTTNGSVCVGITLCSETNTDGGCVTGYDGACIQSVPALNSPDPKVCKPYTSCADAFYTSHTDCQIASKKCTTNGTTGCIALSPCQQYTSEAGCKINDKGVAYTSGGITSTGICTWEATSTSCRDQSCADLTGTTHSTCASQLSSCTSDGTTCLIKGVCSSYTSSTACTTAVGSDGICYWELASASNNNTAKCRLQTCADIQNGTATNVCSVALPTCVSNGTICIPKANCSTYTTKTACNSGGLDGICVFTQSTATGAAVGTGTCSLMTQCTSANNDQTACQAARDRCSWTAASGTGTTAVASKCANHTCATNQATNGACTRFLNWDKKTQQVCTLVAGTCTATDPSTLTSNDCFLVSGYTYTWNASTSKCGVCTAVVIQPNTSNNNTSQPGNETNTDSGYILGLSTIILGLFLQ